MNLIRLIVLLTSLLGLFVACSKVKSPEQIAVYTKDEPIAVYARFPESTLIYNATLDLEVPNVDRAAKRAKEIAFEQGGYLISAQSWYRDGEKHTTVILALPVYQFERTWDDLLRMGTLTGEWISSELVSPGSGMHDIYVQITIYLHPKDPIVPEILLPKWRPVRTFEKAFGVFVSIFGFILDIVIWVTVVAGPFVLMGWGALKFYNWWRKPKAKISEDAES